MRPGLAALAIYAVLSTSATASGPSIAVTPDPVHRGMAVALHGVVPGCPVGDRVTLMSRAFAHRHEFAGVPAVFARVGANHAYSARTTIPAARRAGHYAITARCGGGNLGVSATLRVLR